MGGDRGHTTPVLTEGRVAAHVDRTFPPYKAGFAPALGVGADWGALQRALFPQRPPEIPVRNLPIVPKLPNPGSYIHWA